MRKTYSILQSKRTFFIIALLILVSVACLSTTPATLPPLPTVTSSGENPPSITEWIDVYFTDPDNPNSGSYRGGPDATLAEAIDAARSSVDASIYHLNLWSIRDALINAHQRGVTVRVVTESDNLDEAEIQQVMDAGIPVVSDRRESLMHNKFVVIDAQDVWTGSMNFTVNGGYRNDNNLIHIRSSRLAENYTIEFEEMFASELFGNYTAANTPHPSLTVEGIRLDTSFSPDDGTAAQILDLIYSAEKSIYFMAFSFTSDDIAAAMIEQAARGVDVAGVMEESQYHSNTGGEFDNLLNSGIDVRLDGNRNNMHHKVIIMDDAIVITGSYNFSRSAEERNDENTLFIYSAEVATQYLAEFERVYAKAQVEGK